MPSSGGRGIVTSNHRFEFTVASASFSRSSVHSRTELCHHNRDCLHSKDPSKAFWRTHAPLCPTSLVLSCGPAAGIMLTAVNLRRLLHRRQLFSGMRGICLPGERTTVLLVWTAGTQIKMVVDTPESQKRTTVRLPECHVKKAEQRYGPSEKALDRNPRVKIRPTPYPLLASRT